MENNNLRKMRGSRSRPSLSRGKLFSSDKDNTDIRELLASRLRSLNMHQEHGTEWVVVDGRKEGGREGRKE